MQMGTNSPNRVRASVDERAHDRLPRTPGARRNLLQGLDFHRSSIAIVRPALAGLSRVPQRDRDYRDAFGRLATGEGMVMHCCTEGDADVRESGYCP